MYAPHTKSRLYQLAMLTSSLKEIPTTSHLSLHRMNCRSFGGGGGDKIISNHYLGKHFLPPQTPLLLTCRSQHAQTYATMKVRINVQSPEIRQFTYLISTTSSLRTASSAPSLGRGGKRDKDNPPTGQTSYKQSTIRFQLSPLQGFRHLHVHFYTTEIQPVLDGKSKIKRPKLVQPYSHLPMVQHKLPTYAHKLQSTNFTQLCNSKPSQYKQTKYFSAQKEDSCSNNHLYNSDVK